MGEVSRWMLQVEGSNHMVLSMNAESKGVAPKRDQDRSVFMTARGEGKWSLSCAEPFPANGFLGKKLFEKCSFILGCQFDEEQDMSKGSFTELFRSI
jgi:hypothetical protein